MKRILEAITEGSKETRATAYIYAIVAYGAALSKVSLQWNPGRFFDNKST